MLSCDGEGTPEDEGRLCHLPFDSCGILACEGSTWEGIQPGKGTQTRKIRLVSAGGAAIGLLLWDGGQKLQPKGAGHSDSIR